jgi:hypothetical protein
MISKAGGLTIPFSMFKTAETLNQLVPHVTPSLPLYQAHLAVVKTNRTEFKLRTFERHANVAANNSS